MQYFTLEGENSGQGEANPIVPSVLKQNSVQCWPAAIAQPLIYSRTYASLQASRQSTYFTSLSFMDFPAPNHFLILNFTFWSSLFIFSLLSLCLFARDQPLVIYIFHVYLFYSICILQSQAFRDCTCLSVYFWILYVNYLENPSPLLHKLR